MLGCSAAGVLDSTAGTLGVTAGSAVGTTTLASGTVGVAAAAGVVDVSGAAGTELGAAGTAPEGVVVFSTPGAAGALGTGEKPSITLPVSVGVLWLIYAWLPT